ncbi:MAG: hypothetical protein PUE29_08295, partial [Olsenella sp.]|nr:hypothetical protein [Olsenella sp.]
MSLQLTARWASTAFPLDGKAGDTIALPCHGSTDCHDVFSAVLDSCSHSLADNCSELGKQVVLMHLAVERFYGDKDSQILLG